MDHIMLYRVDFVEGANASRDNRGGDPDWRAGPVFRQPLTELTTVGDRHLDRDRLDPHVIGLLGMVSRQRDYYRNEHLEFGPAFFERSNGKFPGLIVVHDAVRRAMRLNVKLWAIQGHAHDRRDADVLNLKIRDLLTKLGQKLLTRLFGNPDRDALFFVDQHLLGRGDDNLAFRQAFDVIRNPVFQAARVDSVQLRFRQTGKDI